MPEAPAPDLHVAGSPAAGQRVSSGERLTELRYRLFPDHVIGEILSKGWVDNATPFAFLVIVLALFGALIPDFFSTASLVASGRQLGEFGCVVLGEMVVMVGGGIDLSVGSNFALGNIVALMCMNLAGMPAGAALACTLTACGAVGLLNGVLVGYLRLRAFLTTLVVLIIVRAIVDTLLLQYSVAISTGSSDSAAWDWIGDATLAGVPFSMVVLLALCAGGHVILSRTRPGWHVMAVGGSRRSAHNAGISVRRTVCATYVIAGLLVGLASFLFAARLGSTGSDTGAGLELSVLTAAILGGNSLGGGRGSTAKALMGSITVLAIVNGVVRLGLHAGAGPLVLGLFLLLAIVVDVRWLKNRHKILSKVYISPAYQRLAPAPSAQEGSGSPYALNDKLADVEVIGLDMVDGPEDVIFDRDDHMYTGSRHGDIHRFLAPDYQRHEIFAHIGGFPLGMAFDPEDNLLVCVGGMGLYRVRPDRVVEKVTDETNRTRLSVNDDTRLRLADDLDIAPDGKIYFSEATIRYEMHTWPVDALEARGNGRLICYDPARRSTRTILRGLRFPNGVCMAHDNQSFLFAQTWACSISRHWIAGPRAGQTELLIDNLPGHPDNINRASDGTYWLALVGMRSPVVDLALRMPGFRRRMARRVAADEWLYPNINIGCVVKIDDRGQVLDALWDRTGRNHPMITSMREHKGFLYLGGILNNRIGRYRIPGADPEWTSRSSYWGARA
jgi:ribose transport system permease protein